MVDNQLMMMVMKIMILFDLHMMLAFVVVVGDDGDDYDRL